MSNSVNYKEKLKKELICIEKECSQDGWDGYDAISISQEVIKRTKDLIDNLPDRDICRWFTGKTKNFFIDIVTGISPDGTINIECCVFGNIKFLLPIIFEITESGLIEVDDGNMLTFSNIEKFNEYFNLHIDKIFNFIKDN
jgi:hypothetical protein